MSRVHVVGDPVLLAVPALVLLGGLLTRRGVWATRGLDAGPAVIWRELPLAARLRSRRGPRRASAAGDLHRLRSALAGGTSLHGALELVAAGEGPWAPPVGRVLARTEAGQPLDQSLDAWLAEQPDATVVLLVDTLVIVARTGGSHHRAIGAVVDLVHEQEALAAEVRSLTSQARASAVVLVVTPLGFAALLAVVDDRIRTFFVASWLGVACVACGLALDGVGGWWMRRVVRSVR